MKTKTNFYRHWNKTALPRRESIWQTKKEIKTLIWILKVFQTIWAEAQKATLLLKALYCHLLLLHPISTKMGKQYLEAATVVLNSSSFVDPNYWKIRAWVNWPKWYKGVSMKITSGIRGLSLFWHNALIRLRANLPSILIALTQKKSSYKNYKRRLRSVQNCKQLNAPFLKCSLSTRRECLCRNYLFTWKENFLSS